MDNIFIFILIGMLAYLLGSVPVGFLVAKSRGMDIQQAGSGSIGATNISRNLGWKLGVVVGVLDFCKSFLPALLVKQWYSQNWQVFIVAILVVVGHIFPVWLKFKGGKGVATIFGILAAFFGLPIFLLFLFLWLLIVKLVDVMSLVNLGVGLLLPLAFWIKFQALPEALMGLVMGMIIWYAHRENIKRLLAGTENRLGTPK
ncbi:MAG: glycerol-3-phosphate 1-O-acyltransferase PlsY [Brevefilum sp.]|nr:glycerol-3-phosphate 1-O-acyltransferase PlsY [Brevefilum sp.]